MAEFDTVVAIVAERLLGMVILVVATAVTALAAPPYYANDC